MTSPHFLLSGRKNDNLDGRRIRPGRRKPGGAASVMAAKWRKFYQEAIPAENGSGSLILPETSPLRHHSVRDCGRRASSFLFRPSCCGWITLYAHIAKLYEVCRRVAISCGARLACAAEKYDSQSKSSHVEGEEPRAVSTFLPASDFIIHIQRSRGAGLCVRV